MISILLIADQPRLHALISAAADLPETKIRVSTSLNQGLEEIAAETPSLLFVQSRLSGLSGEIITRHFKSELQGKNTTLVVLIDSANDADACGKIADITLDQAAPDRELVQKFREIIASLGTEKSQQTATKRPAGTKRSSPREKSSISPLAETVVDAVSVGGENTAPTKKEAGKKVAPSRKRKTAVSPTFQDELDALTGTPVADAGEGDDNPAASRTNETGNTAERVSAFEFNHYTSPDQQKKRRLRPAHILVVLVLGTALLLLLARDRFLVKKAAPPPPQSGQRSPNNKKEPSRPAASPLVQLPGFIPRETLDGTYGATHPGWERYVTAAAEFRIYRESSAIKAIQVLDRSGNGLKPAFFTKVLQETAGTRDYRLASKEQNQGHLVKRGSLSAQSVVIIYKDTTDTILQAFVIHPVRHGSADSSFALDVGEIGRDRTGSPSPHEATHPSSLKPAGNVGAKQVLPTGSSGGKVAYTVKRGDHIFRILMQEFGMSNSEAERMLPEIQRMNNIPDIKHLAVGQTLLIPAAKRKSAAPHAAPASPRPVNAPSLEEPRPAPPLPSPSPPPEPPPSGTSR